MLNNTNIPLVSICIPTYNGAAYIAQAMDSAINQTYGSLEIIVSDDASTDTTLDIIEGYKAKTNIPIYIYHHQPKGIGANWNHCIKHAKGEYIKFLFQDDVLFPNCIKEMVAIFEGNESIGLVASKREFIYDEGYYFPDMEDWIERFGDLQKNLNLKVENGISLIDNLLFKHKLFFRSPLNKIGEPSTFIFRKDVINDVGYFREDLIQILDYEFCYRLLRNYKIAIINKKLVKFRLHAKQVTNLNRLGVFNASNDNEGYSKILFNEYLKYVDPYIKRHLLKKHHILYRIVYGVKLKLKKLFTIH